jgi:septum formation protein
MNGAPNPPVRRVARPARPLLLASSSRHRKALLARLRLPFSCQAPATDETARPGEPPAALVRRLALAKAQAARIPADGPALVIGSDQIAVIDGRILGKPGTRHAALQQLGAAAGNAVEFLTGVCVFDQATAHSQVDIVPCTVLFRALTAAQIAAYVDAEQPWDCAGSFMAEGLGIALFEKIVSDDPTALIGLPLIRLVTMLAAFGYDVLCAASPAEFDPLQDAVHQAGPAAFEQSAE